MEKNPTKLFSKLNVLFTKDDNILMKKVKNGNNEAYVKLFNKYKRPIMNYIYQMTKNQSKSEEIAQDVFLKIFTHASSYDEKKKFSTWLWTIAKNTTIDYLRKKKEILADDYASYDEEGKKSSMMDSIPSSELSHDIKIIEASEKKVVQGCIDKLPSNQKEILTLRIFSELSYQEIAGMVEKSTSAIKSTLNRVKDSLALCVQNCLLESE